jgi:ABC-type nitrate/sulfonate/bicarbonate transport system permease component
VKPSIGLRAAVVSLLLLAFFLLLWQVGTSGSGAVTKMDPEYAKLMGLNATEGKSAMPGPFEVGVKLWQHLKSPFYDNGPNDKGIGIQLAYSIGRVLLGYFIAVLVAIPIGFLIGMSPLMNRALNPFIQVLKPISPLAWMPLALYTIKDSSISAIFVIFICSVWPMLINTAFGVASVRKEWLNVARTLEVSPLAGVHGDFTRRSAHDSHGHADFHRHCLARDCRSRNARGRYRHRLFRLERMEQPFHHQCHHGDLPDWNDRHVTRSSPRPLRAPRDVSRVVDESAFHFHRGYRAALRRRRQDFDHFRKSLARNDKGRIRLHYRAFGLRKDNRAEYSRGVGRSLGRRRHCR